MSYLHCPSCRRAYNVAERPACPSCGVQPGAPADPVDDVVAMAEQLARAIGRATPDQVAAARQRLGFALAPPPAMKALPPPPPRYASIVARALVLRFVPRRARELLVRTIDRLAA